MAFTALYFPLDNDQNQPSLWLDNDDQATTGDNFYEQFLTLDPEDATTLGNELPPSPSLVLESLQKELNNHSSSPLGLPLSDFHPEMPAISTSQPMPIAPVTASAAQVGLDSEAPATLAVDPILSTGSISDSELLRIEGISLKSSPHRRNVTAPSSPSGALAPSSPRKHGRFAEAFYATIRRAAHRPKPAEQELQPIDTVNLDNFLGDPRSELDVFDLNYDGFVNPNLSIEQEPIDGHGLPSPPLTGRIPNDHQHSSSGFVSGHLDDPFCDDSLDTPVTMHLNKHQDINTPMSTPLINETFSQNTNMDMFRTPQKVYRSASSAEWPDQGLLTNVNLWPPPSSSAIHVADNGNSASWWDVSQTGETMHADCTTNGMGRNISIHHHPADIPYEYSTEVSGLMIQTPQPRTPQASILNPNLNEHMLAALTASSSNYHMHGTPAMTRRTRTNHMPQGNANGSKGYSHTDKRSRPRAPSSGARHHGAQTSPRKLRNSMSMGYLREESHSPSPTARQHGRPHPHAPPNGHHHHQGTGYQERRQHRSSSLTMRKQRSFTRRDSRTSSASFATSPGGGGGGGGGLNFINFTPDHRKELMTGVAPSGSSKTKERREKEAREREREAQEKARRLALQAVEAAGGDVTKLMGGFDI